MGGFAKITKFQSLNGFRKGPGSHRKRQELCSDSGLSLSSPEPPKPETVKGILHEGGQAHCDTGILNEDMRR